MKEIKIVYNPTEQEKEKLDGKRIGQYVWTSMDDSTPKKIYSTCFQLMGVIQAKYPPMHEEDPRANDETLKGKRIEIIIKLDD